MVKKLKPKRENSKAEISADKKKSLKEGSPKDNRQDGAIPLLTIKLMKKPPKKGK